jgi:hypothetical protein
VQWSVAFASLLLLLLVPADVCSVLKYQDWVWSVLARGGLLLVASGPEVHVHDLPTGKLVRKVRGSSSSSSRTAGKSITLV